jgi:glucosamine--fructose-6-phosphate aminotransferase (isomerizing)
MCGIAGYVGHRKCKNFIIEGLSRLEYRGYDSAGFVCIDEKNQHLSFVKEVGPVQRLKETLEKIGYDGTIGVGHTRWASHGPAEKANAHPQFDCQKTLAVVHNGILEGHLAIRKRLLQEGHFFDSITDTEVAAHLLGEAIAFHKSLRSAILSVITQLKGAYALVFLVEKEPNKLILIRHKSPLVIGVGDSEMFVGSDPVVFADQTNKVLFMPDNSYAIVSPNHIELYDFQNNPIVPVIKEHSFLFEQSNKKEYEHYLIKEIYEQKRAIENSILFFKKLNGQITDYQSQDAIVPAYVTPNNNLDGFWGQIGLDAKKIAALQSIDIVAAGTSWYAGYIGTYFFQEIAQIPTTIQLASEYRYNRFFKKDNHLVLAISQSGETADTLEAMRLAKKNNVTTACITNVAASTMMREADGYLLMQAGIERSVASTKSFSSQITSLYWLAHRVAIEKNIIAPAKLKEAEEQLHLAAEILECSIENYKWEIIEKDAPFYATFEKFIFLGRNISYPFALEAALKLKELSYIFAHGYPAGELKHGPLALIDEKTPVVIFSVLDELIYTKLLSNAQEVKARKGHLVVFAFEGQEELISLADRYFIFPHSAPLLAPLVMTGVMQFWVYQITKYLGRPIDMPRNLAKSVTIE